MLVYRQHSHFLGRVLSFQVLRYEESGSDVNGHALARGFRETLSVDFLARHGSHPVSSTTSIATLR